MRLIWAPFARQDLAAIHRYIAEHDPRAAKAVALHIANAAKLLRDQPNLGRRTHREGVRRLVVANSVYSIIYRLRDEDIEIIEIFDGRRRAPRTALRERGS